MTKAKKYISHIKKNVLEIGEEIFFVCLYEMNKNLVIF
jgi:hypothetical protein